MSAREQQRKAILPPEAIAGRCGDRVRWAHKEVLRGGRSLSAIRTCNSRERHGGGEDVVGVRNRGSSRYLRGALGEQGSDGGGGIVVVKCEDVVWI